MIDLDFVERLIRALDESSLDSLEFERGGTRVRLSKSPVPQVSYGPAGNTGAAPGPDRQLFNGQPNGIPGEALEISPDAAVEGPGEPEKAGLLEVTSPMVGTFYRSPAPDAPSYVEVGTRIGQGTVLCIIEAMKLMNELESEVEGTIAKVLVENAQPVEYGQVLFLIDPS